MEKITQPRWFLKCLERRWQSVLRVRYIRILSLNNLLTPKCQIPHEIIDSTIQKYGMQILERNSGGGTADTPRSGRGALTGVRVQIPP